MPLSPAEFRTVILALATLVTLADALLAQAKPNAPRDTLSAAIYQGWKQYRSVCDRCHGEEATGTSFGPSLVKALAPGGSVPDRAAFQAIMLAGVPAKGMPSATTLGVPPDQFDGLYQYLHGRSTGRYKGGRPAMAP